MKSLIPSLRIAAISLLVSLIIGIIGYFALGSISIDTNITNAVRYQTYILMIGALLGALVIQLIHAYQSRPAEVVSLYMKDLENEDYWWEK